MSESKEPKDKPKQDKGNKDPENEEEEEEKTPEHVNIDEILAFEKTEKDEGYHYKFKNGKRKYLFCSDSSDSTTNKNEKTPQKPKTYKENALLTKKGEDDSDLELIPTQIVKPEPFHSEGRKMLQPEEAAVKRNNKFLDGMDDDDKIKEIDFDPDDFKKESESEQGKESPRREKKQKVSKEVMHIFNNMLSQPNYNADASSAHYAKEEQTSSIKESTPLMEEKLQSKKPSSPKNKEESKSKKFFFGKFEDESDYSDDLPNDFLNRPKRSFKTDSKIKSKWLQ